jgi:putative membrane protein
MVLQSLQGLPAFIAYFCLATVLVIAFLLIYTRITPMNEFELIRKNVPGAAIALGLSLFGFSLPLASAIAHASDLVDCAVWGVVAIIVQIVLFMRCAFRCRIFRTGLQRGISRRRSGSDSPRLQPAC